jgi:two-component system, chemotaxis family, CheB/CheR fusion protein
MEQQQTFTSFGETDYKQLYIEFIDIASHDLQAPLRKLGVLTERLTSKYKEHNNPEIEEYIRRINTCITDMRSLIDGLGELATVIPEKSEYISCDLNNLLKKVMHEFDPQVQAMKADITIGELPTIQGDALQLRQLFKQVLQNALRFVKPGIPTIVDVRCHIVDETEKIRRKLDRSKVYYQVVVADNGIGFNPDDAEKIFRPLVRLNGKSAFEGNGLGLAICDKIVSNHGGIIFAESVKNAGSRFRIILPETL